MSRYKVAFTVDSTVLSVQCSQVKVGNMFLQCKDETATNDQATVAMVPFEAVDYIVHDSVTVSFDDVSGAGGREDSGPVVADTTDAPTSDA